ncbi:hypothetical protein BX667DRAFT_497739 [Coemansia mojavensis]|nr:hypothetical protein BX667DRAFT_504107 [Coemansia mojavensis]KAI9474888.1 hypothetical protein BX667DRAFT_497739 [Coemansia mojavensis]
MLISTVVLVLVLVLLLCLQLRNAQYSGSAPCFCRLTNAAFPTALAIYLGKFEGTLMPVFWPTKSTKMLFQGVPGNVTYDKEAFDAAAGTATRTQTELPVDIL